MAGAVGGAPAWALSLGGGLGMIGVGNAAPLYARESVGSVTGERPAADVVRELVAGAEQALRDARDLLV